MEVTMLNLLRVYKALLRAAFATALEYRAQIIIWLFSFIFPLVMMTVWLNIVDEVGPAVGWEKTDFISYYVGVLMVSYLTMVGINWDWDEDIRTGNLSVKLLKPLDPFHQLVVKIIGWKLFFIMLIVPLIAIAAWLLPAIYYPLTFGRVVVFALSIAAGFMLNILVGSTIGVLAFWFTQSANLWLLWYGVGQFLSGFIAPLELFPTHFREIAELLPFRSGLGFPMGILMGHLTWPEIGFGFIITGCWSLVFLILYRLLWHTGLKRYEAVGA